MAEYNSDDWENIPQIIPSAIASVSKQLQDIQSWIKVKDGEESTFSLSVKLNKQESRLLEKLEKIVSDKDLQIDKLNTRFGEMGKEIEKLKEKPIIEEAVVQTDLAMKDFELHSDISEDDHSEDEDLGNAELSTEPNNLNKIAFSRILKKQKEVKKVDMKKPRMYSLELFKKLFFKYLNRSRLKSKVLMQEKLIPEIESKTEDTNLRLDQVIQEFSVEVKNIYEQLEFFKESLTKLFSEVEDKLKEVNKWSERVDQKFSDYEINQDDFKLKYEVTHEEYDSLKQVTKRLEDRIGEVVKDLKEDSRKKVDSCHKNLKKEVSKSVSELSVKIEETNTFIENKYKIIEEEYLKAIKDSAFKLETHTKDLAAELTQQILDYRKFYECDMEAFQKVYNENRVELMESDKKVLNDLKKLRTEFDKWVNTVMEPAHISEARIFAVEARVKEEEASRLDQLHFMKDVLRKLLFSLEQVQISGVAGGTRPATRGENDQNLGMYMKRLGFLKKLVQYSVDQQKSRGNYVRRPTPLGNKELLNRTADIINEPFITEKLRDREDDVNI